jgi:ankyrin repeat protein
MSKHKESSTDGLPYEDVRDLVASGELPSDYNRWKLADSNGWTIAHVAAYYGGLPEEFKQYWMADVSGTTVAHIAAMNGHLPENFSRWNMAGARGGTVLRSLLRHGGKVGTHKASLGYLERIKERWDREKPLCETDADWEVFKKELPEVYYKYTIDETMGTSCNDGYHGAIL